jgi:hypothetical protein
VISILRSVRCRVGLLPLFALLASFLPAVPAEGQHCAGDCSNDREVTVDELVVCLGVALGSGTAFCPVCDRGGDGSVGIDDLVRAVRNALSGCPADVLPTIVTFTIEPKSGCVPDTSEITIELVVCVTNQGAKMADSFRIEVNGETFGRTEPLAPDGEYCLGGQFTNGTVDIFADVLDEVPEDDERNNFETFFIPVPTLPPLCTPTSTATVTPLPSDTPTASPTETATPSPTATPPATDTASPSATPSGTATSSPTATATAIDTATDTPTAPPTETNTETPTAAATEAGTNTPTATSQPADTSTVTPAATETPSPTQTPDVSDTPTATATGTPTATSAEEFTTTATPTETPTTTGDATASPTATLQP